MSDKTRITILGAGFAGLETAFLLRMRLRDRVDLTLVSERDAFTFRPNTIYVPFGADPDDLRRRPVQAVPAPPRRRSSQGSVSRRRSRRARGRSSPTAQRRATTSS